jgi:hypothetical protein
MSVTLTVSDWNRYTEKFAHPAPQSTTAVVAALAATAHYTVGRLVETISWLFH